MSWAKRLWLRVRGYAVGGVFLVIGATLLLSAATVQKRMTERLAEAERALWAQDKITTGDQHTHNMQEKAAHKDGGLADQMRVVGWSLSSAGAVLLLYGFWRRRTLAQNSDQQVVREVHGHKVTVDDVAHDGYDVTRIALPFPDCPIRLEERTDPRLATTHTGDPNFDALLRVTGDEWTARALLTAPVRERLVGLCRRYHLAVKDDVISLRFNRLATDLIELDMAVADLAWLRGQLAVDRPGNREALLRSALADPEPDTRLACGILAAASGVEGGFEDPRLAELSEQVHARDWRSAVLTLGSLEGSEAIKQAARASVVAIHERAQLAGGTLSLADPGDEGAVSLIDQDGALTLSD